MSDPIPWRWYDGTLPKGDILAWDVETSWFENKKNDIIQVAVSSGEDTVVARQMDDILDLFNELQHTPNLITHNGWWADVPWVEESLSFEMPWGEDTMVLGYLMDENQSLSLKNLAMKYLGVENWKEGLNADKDSDDFAEYNARDALYTWQLRSTFNAYLGERRRLGSHIIFPGFTALKACTERGIYISPEAVENAEIHFKSEISRLQGMLETEHGIVKPRSPKVIGDALRSDGHSLGTTASGQFKTDRGTVARLKSTPLVDTLREFRVADKAYSAFVKPYKRIVESEDGRAHAGYSIIRTVTGRTSASGPNIQQLPRLPMLRAFFSAPPGHQLISADYSAIEFRVAAWVAGETGIIERYRDNPAFDPHTWITAQFYGIEESAVTKEQRQIFKSYNFGLLYMAQPKTVREYILKTTGVLISLEEAKRGFDFWHKQFPAFKQWYINTWDALKINGFTESATGRRRNFGEPGAVIRQPQWKRAADLREAVNFQVQSLAADIALIGLSRASECGLPINGFIHDSISFEFREGEYDMEHTQPLIQHCMVDYPIQYLKQHFGVDFDMPLQIEIK